MDPRAVRAPVVRCHVPRRGPTASSDFHSPGAHVSDNKLVAETRTQFGKGAARKIRRDNKIPAVMYGHGSEPVHITLPGHQSMLALKQSNALLTIVIDGKEQLALAKDVQRDPIKPVIEHVDLVIVQQGREGRRRRQRAPRGRGRPRDRRHHRPHAACSSRSWRPTSPRASPSRSRASTAGTQILAGQVELPEGATLRHRRRGARRQRHRAGLRRGPRGRAVRGRGRGRHRARGVRRGGRRVRAAGEAAAAEGDKASDEA